MKNDIKIVIEDGKAKLFTPYNGDFVSRIKKAGSAKWDAKEKCWTIPEVSVSAAREIMTEVYGYNDISEGETVNIRITVNSELSKQGKDVILFGKVLSHAFGRDSGGKSGDDVFM